MDETAVTLDQTVESAYSEFIRNSTKAKWKMPYFDNMDVHATNSCPTYAGFHRNSAALDERKIVGPDPDRSADPSLSQILV